ncbi:MAG: hypothetical protein JO149_08600 [Gammaproteobacteria bacterium]|nr:hypothetical protein [Gammaproteobacteria bacterium]
METRKKRLVALIDADGCIYNGMYLYLVYYLIAQHGVAISTWATEVESSEDEDNKKSAEVGLIKIAKELDDLIEYFPEDNVAKAIHVHSSNNQTNEEAMQAEILLLIRDIFQSRDIHLSLEKLTENDFKSNLQLAVEDLHINLQRLGDPGQHVLKTLLFVGNKPFFNEIVARMEKEEFDCLDLFSASSRQSKSLDDSNSIENDTGSFFIDLGLIHENFKEFLPDKECTLHDIVLADIYGDCEIGESWKRILKERKKNEAEMYGKNCSDSETDNNAEIIHAEYIFDDTKFSLLYGLLHYIRSKFQNDKIVAAYFDDRADIHSVLATIFMQDPDLILSSDMILEFIPYAGYFPAKYLTRTNQLDFLEKGSVLVIKGEGNNNDFNFRENVKKIAMMCGHDLKNYDKGINAAYELDINLFKQERVLYKASMSSVFAGMVSFYAPASAIKPQAKSQIDEEKITKGLRK